MAYESGVKKIKRSAIRRMWWHCLLIALPGLIFDAVLLFEGSIGVSLALLLAACQLIFLALVAASLVDGIVRPLQTLSNVLASLREGDTRSVRAAQERRMRWRAGCGSERAGGPFAETACAFS